MWYPKPPPTRSAWAGKSLLTFPLRWPSWAEVPRVLYSGILVSGPLFWVVVPRSVFYYSGLDTVKTDGRESDGTGEPLYQQIIVSI